MAVISVNKHRLSSFLRITVYLVISACGSDTIVDRRLRVGNDATNSTFGSDETSDEQDFGLHDDVTGTNASPLSDAILSDEKAPDLPCPKRMGVMIHPDEGSGRCTGNLISEIPLPTIGTSIFHNSVGSSLSGEPEWAAGIGWNLGSRGVLTKSGDDLNFTSGDGSAWSFVYRGDGTWSHSDTRQSASKFVQRGSTTIEETFVGGRRTYQRQEGETYRLTSIHDRNGNRLSLEREGTNEYWRTYPSGSNTPTSEVRLEISGGKISNITDTAGGSYTFVYNSNNLLVKVVYPDQTTTTVEYIAGNLISKMTGPTGLVTRYAYFPGGVLKAVVNHLNYVTRFSYDNNSVTREDDFGRETEFFAKFGSRMLQVSLDSGAKRVSNWTREPGALGRVTEYQAANGERVFYEYDQVTIDLSQ